MNLQKNHAVGQHMCFSYNYSIVLTCKNQNRPIFSKKSICVNNIIGESKYVFF